MKLITLDFETAYGKHPVTGENITLSSMTTEEYIRHPLFKVHCVGLKYDDDPAFFIEADEIKEVFDTIDWGRIALLCHHAHFDGAILNWVYGHKPLFWIDTLSMANAKFPWMSSSLNKVAEHYNVGTKGGALVKTKDLWDLPAHVMRTLGEYCLGDVDLTYSIYQKMKIDFPVSEMRLIDNTVRMFTEPEIEIDRRVLIEDYVREARAKRTLMKQSNTTREELMSNEKFAALLASIGVTPPRKISERTGKETWAFAKSDEEFKLLLEHPNEKVRHVVEARMSVKSTIKETRSKRFYKIGSRGPFPVYLRYYGAHTGRWSGGDKQNAQNLNRVDSRDPTSGALRRSWVAPKGKVFVVCDLSQIEARMLAYWAEQEDLVEAFRNKVDPYCHMASGMYGRTISKKDKRERQVGKATVLGCGYQMGWMKFQESLRVGFLGMPSLIFDSTYAEQLGIDVKAVLSGNVWAGGSNVPMWKNALEGLPINTEKKTHLIHCAVTKGIIDKYRSANAKVVSLWEKCQNVPEQIISGVHSEVGRAGLIRTTNLGLRMPNGLDIQYHRLNRSANGPWQYLANERKKEWKYIYGGKMVENAVQGLSRIVLGEQLIKLALDVNIVSTTHDEIIAIVPEKDAESTLTHMQSVMGTAPIWAPGLPLEATGGFHKCYGYCEK